MDLSDAGDIIVTPRPIKIRTPDAVKDYDGEPLTNENWEIVSITKPIDNHLLEVAVSGTRIDVGTSENFIAEVKITDKVTGEDVTYNYAITEQLGILSVKGDGTTPPEEDPEGKPEDGPGDDSEEDPEGNPGGGPGDGSEENPEGNPGGGSGGGSGGGGGKIDISGSLSDCGDDDKSGVFLKLYSAKTGPIYLRLKSFGDFDPAAKEWGEAVSYEQLLDGKYCYNYLSGVALKNTGIESVRIEIENFTDGQYFVPYFPDMFSGTNYDIQTDDVLYTGDSSVTYSLYYYLYSGYFTGINADLGEYSDEELEYRKFVKDNYLYVDEELKAYMESIIETNGFDPASTDVIMDVAKYIQNAAKYNLDYNTEIDGAAHPIIAFLTQQEGVCRHFSSAATALYRTLGIPARYTIGFAGFTESEEWTEITAKQAHAWVEVYIDEIGWLPIEVTGFSDDSPGVVGGIGGSGGSGGENSGGREEGEGGENGEGDSSGEENKQSLKIAPENSYHKYDGNYAYPIHEVRGLSKLLEKGFSYEAVVELINSPANLPGLYETRIQSFILYNAEKQDVTSDYKIEYEEGTLQIYLAEIKVSTSGATKEYDGTSLTSDVYVIEGKLLNGHMLKSLTCTGSQMNVGKCTNSFTISIVDDTGIDITAYYKINRICEDLIVTPKALTITANSNSKKYDGNALVDTGYTIEGDIDGYTVEVTVVGSQTQIGYSDNIVRKVVVKDSAGRDVTLNFSINCINGKLSVTPPTN